MMTDADLKSELRQLGFSPGPITAGTRSTYLKKLQKLQMQNGGSHANEDQLQDDTGYDAGEPVNGARAAGELYDMSDSELRAELLRLGLNPGPITPATRGVYLKKLARLQEEAFQPAAAAGVTATTARRRRASPARVSQPIGPGAPAAQPPPEALAAIRRAERRAEELAAVERAERRAAEEAAGEQAEVGQRRPSGTSPLAGSRFVSDYESMDEWDSPPSVFDSGRQSVFGPSAATAYSLQPKDTPNGRYQCDSAADSRPFQSDLNSSSRYKPEVATGGSRYGLGSTLMSDRYQPSSLASDSGLSSVTYRSPVGVPQRTTPLPPQPYRPPATRSDVLYPLQPRSQTKSNNDASRTYLSNTSPYKQHPPAAEKPATPAAVSLRQRVAEWYRPSSSPSLATDPTTPTSPLDYDTCSDSDDDSGGVSASEQLRRFRARMSPVSRASEPSARRRFGSEAARSAASHLVPGCILLVALAFFGGLLFMYLSLGRGESFEQLPEPEEVPTLPANGVAVWPICGTVDAWPELGCVPSERLESAVQLLDAVQGALTTAARDALCRRRDAAVVPLTELADMIQTPGPDAVGRLRDLATVVAHNPQLGVSANLTGTEVTLEAVGISTPWLCAIATAVNWILKWAATVAAVVAGGMAVRGLVWWQVRRRKQQQQRLYQMVERVLEVVRGHCAAAPSDQPYVAVNHVRDQLLSPSQRTDRAQMALWQDTVQFIRERESRIREECVLVAGESHTVWRWLPSTAHAAAASGRRVWLGQAFQTGNGVNSPVHTRTNCLKIRHMFDPSCETGQAWVREVQDALLEKCEGLPVLHVVVDQRNAEGLVYAKFRTDADALAAFKRIQGCWFDGRLVSVKFIRLERYHERYPDAASATTPLRPSNELRRSLADPQQPDLEDD